MRLFGGGKALSCQELVELVSDYHDGNLSRRDRSRFEKHIAGCDHCSTYVEQIRQTIAASGRVSEEAIPAEARDELLAAFRGWKAERTAR